MFSDIVFPDNNEQEFIGIASRLGCKKLYFVYDLKHFGEDKVQKKISSLKNEKLDIGIGFMVNHQNIKNAPPNHMTIAKSSDNDRLLMEGRKIKLIYGFEEMPKKDYLHQRASGLNHTLCELARNNNVVIGFSYSSILNKNAALTMGRMMQNISLCRKYKVKTAISSFSHNPFGMRSADDITSLFTLLGMDSKAANDSVSSIF